MSKLPRIDPATATGAAAELLTQVQETLGVTPNMTKVMANSSALLRGYLALSGALGTGVISAPVRERLAVATAGRCHRCRDQQGELRLTSPGWPVQRPRAARVAERR